MQYTRLLKRSMCGSDVKAVKDKLVELGYLHASTHDCFGSDTLAAVRAYQSEHALDPDGIVGPLTWAALFGDAAPVSDGPSASDTALDADPGDLLGHIGNSAAQAILSGLGGVNALRQAVVFDALQFAVDPNAPGEHPRSLYIRGGNLYNQDLTANVITLARIASGAAKQPQYYDGGRREMMEAAVRACPDITGADCSGGIVGLMRHSGIYTPGFDANADTLADRHARAVKQADLRPGDWLHKSGHIGLYVGGGYGVEWVGGAYGCQLTAVARRRCYSYVDGRLHTMGAWTGFMRPVKY